MIDFYKRIAALSPKKRALLTLKLSQQDLDVAEQGKPTHKRLVAYVVLQNKLASSTDELRHFLKKQLPEYMVPSNFVLLDNLPRTPNGKVDRRALQKAPDLRTELGFVAPRTTVEEVMAGIWAEILGVELVGIHENFFELGGHSLLVTQLITRLREAFQVDLSLRSLFEAPTVAELSEGIETRRRAGARASSTNVLSLEAEAVLDSTIRPALPFEYPTEPAYIFLTGATGFQGTFLLYELLQQTQAVIYCLVRASDAEEGRKRLQSSLKSYSLWHESFSSRIIPVVGDLSKPLLGLTQEQFQVMASQIDVIYHNGAWVNFTYSYTVLKAANVLGTQEVLKLASQIKVKPVHFVSTTSIFSSAADSAVRVVREQDSIGRGEGLNDDGYNQTKWVAEKLVTIARDRGLPICIYRPGLISGHSQTGACNTDDLMSRTIKGCIQLGSVPDQDLTLDIVPGDYVGRAIVYLSRQKASIGKVFHLVNPQLVRWSDLVNWIRLFGYPLQEISYRQWRTKLLNATVSSQENALYPLVPIFSAESEEQTNFLPEIQFDCQNTLDGLANSGITFPNFDVKLLNRYLFYFIQSGFLDPPQAGKCCEPQID